MNSDEETAYWVPAVENLFPGYDPNFINYGKERALQRALGNTIWDEWLTVPRWGEVPLSEEMKSLLIMLAGPHGKAILRIYQIKHGIEHETVL